MNNEEHNNEETTPQEHPPREETAGETPQADGGRQTGEVQEPRQDAGEGEAEDLFDLMGEEEKKKHKKPKPSEKAASGSATQPKKEEKKPEETYHEAGVEVRYSGFKKPLPERMNEKEILEWLAADDFPEVSPDRAEIVHDTGKGWLVPVLKAHKKGGASTGPSTVGVELDPGHSERSPVRRFLADDGAIYEIRNTPAGDFVARLEVGRIPALKEGFYNSVSPPPPELLGEVVELFRQDPDNEIVVNVVYDESERRHRLLTVAQEGGPASVTYDPLPDQEGIILYAEIHSHASMGAFFSATDDHAEIRTGVYGVIGRIKAKRPEAAFRASVGGMFRPLSVGQVFAGAEKLVAIVEEASP